MSTTSCKSCNQKVEPKPQVIMWSATKHEQWTSCPECGAAINEPSGKAN